MKKSFKLCDMNPGDFAVTKHAKNWFLLSKTNNINGFEYHFLLDGKIEKHFYHYDVTFSLDNIIIHGKKNNRK